MISIIIPTYQSPESLIQAIKSLQQQTFAEWQAVVCPDDGNNYNWLKDLDKRITVVESDLIGTGAGAARNRGLPYVCGDSIGCLDDDDTLSSNYIELAEQALVNNIAVAFPTRYIDSTGSTVRTIGNDVDQLTIPIFSQCLGSIHVVSRLEYFGNMRECFAEDVIHTCELIDRAGGSIRVINNAEYICTINADSVCAQNNSIDNTYDELINEKFESMSALAQKQTKLLFEYRKKINLMYESSDYSDYQRFIVAINT